MSNRFELKIPTVDQDLEHVLQTGEILFVLGPNGSGKSGLISRLFNAHNQFAKRISAHRPDLVYVQHARPDPPCKRQS